LERKLTAILSADVHGYSFLMGEDEEATLQTLSAYRKIIDGLIRSHRGRLVNSAGDSVLAEFTSVVEAVNCGVEIQSRLRTENQNLPPRRRMEFRIGVNLGDVIVEAEQIYGDGVNVAARLESLAEPGGICISGVVHDQVKAKLTLNYRDLGAQQVKNIAEPVHAWRVLLDGSQPSLRLTRRIRLRHWKGGALSLTGLAIAIATFVLVQHLSLKPPRSGASIPPREKLALPLPGIPSIAVLPFMNLSGDPQQEYFSDGITDDLTTALSRSPSLFVIARTSAFTYKGKAVRVQDVSRELGVKYVLEGSVRKADDRVRITAQLVDATTGDHIWAEHYDRTLNDIFSLQDEIVRKIVTTAKLQLSLQEQGLLVRRTTDNLEAYDYYLRGMEFARTPTKETNKKARAMYEQAIELDPDYSDAYALLGWVQLLDMTSQWSHDAQGLTHAIELEQKSIALDDSNALAYAFLSMDYTVTRKYELAVSAAEHAVVLEPNLAWGFGSLAWALAYSEPADAVVAAQKAMRLDPQNGDLYAGSEGAAYTVMGRYEEAIPPLKRYIAYTNAIPGRLYLISCYVELGRNAEAHSEAMEVMRTSPQFSLAMEKQMSPMNPSLRERLYGDMGKAGLN
jgi:adenylate cyclase